MAGIGEVEIKLDGRQEVLRSSLAAAKRVNAAGGFAKVLSGIQAFDLEYYVLVVSAGLGKKPHEVEEAVYKSGLPSLTGDLSVFVNYLANGGKPFTSPEEAAPGAGEA
jgi:hypothetical protein